MQTQLSDPAAGEKTGKREDGNTSSPSPAHSSSADFPPGYLDKVAAMKDAGANAAVNPLPGPLLNAFLPEPIRALGFELRPAVATDFALLQSIKSPLLAELAEQAKPEEERTSVNYQDEDLWELLYIWTRPVSVARSAYRLGGRERFRETALCETGDKLPLHVLREKKQLLAALAVNFARAFSTQLQHAPGTTEGAGQSFPAPSSPATASAGGSTT